MLNKTLTVALAAIVVVVLSNSSRAELVYSDSGSGSAGVAGFDVFGVKGATVTTPPFGDTITEINGSAVTVPLFMSYTLYDDDGVISGSGYKIIGAGIHSALIDFSITSGTVGMGVLDVEGVITRVVTNNLTGYNFLPLVGTENSVDITKTGVNFADVVGKNFTHVSDAGMTLTEGSVPEPASIALLGIGMIGLLGIRRLSERSSAT
jgi:PEP-CTERM motif